MDLRLVKNEPQYYEFIRTLRSHPENIPGFLTHQPVPLEDHLKFMEKYGDNYYVGLDTDEPVGFVAVVNDDYRICTRQGLKRRGIGYFMLSSITPQYPYARAKILKDNLASLALFHKCGFEIYDSDELMHYLKINQA